jgi:hypothetical protein
LYRAIRYNRGAVLAYPVLYDVTYSYTGFQQAQGDNSFPGTQLDADLAGLQDSIDDVAAFLEGVTRSDGALKNGVVTLDSLRTDLLLLITGSTTLIWAPNTFYAAGATVTATGATLARSTIAHTSTASFAADQAAGKWTVLIDFANASNLTSGFLGLAQGGLAASQAAATANQVPVFPGSGGGAVPTGVSAWLDAALSSSVGRFLVRASGGWIAAGMGYANPVWWGADATGASDSTAAFNSALAASGSVRFPGGKFKFLSQITYNLPAGISALKVTGEGQDNTALYWPSGGGMVVNFSTQSQSAHFSDLSFTTGATTANIGLQLIQTGVVAGGAVMAESDLFRVTFRGDDNYQWTDFWSAAVQARGISNLNFESVYIQGPSTANGNGIDYGGLTAGSTYAVQMNITKSIFQNLATGLLYNSYVQGVSVAQSNFTGCTNGIVAGASETGSLSQLAVLGCQFGQFGAGNSIYAQTEISQVILQGNTFITVAGSFASSAVFLARASNYTMTGNVFTGSGGANSNGIVIGTQVASTAGTITGNIIGGYNAGLTLQAASNNAAVSNNKFIANTTNINNTGSSNVINGNPGYNPVGPAGISVGASPFTYTAGASRETVYVFGGTVSSVTYDKNGGGLGTVAAIASPCTIELGPYEQMKITYSVAPNMNKMVH